MSQYSYEKSVNVDRLTEEILTSGITIALDHITTNGGMVTIQFKANISDPEGVELQSIIDNHVNEPLPTEIRGVPVDINKQTDDMDDKVPYVYPTSRPLGYLTNFAGAGDGGEGFSERGKGQEILFNMKDTDVEQTVDLTFNEDVYIKDGALTSIDAPLGAHIDIEIVHPVYGTLDLFGVKIPVLGTSRWPLDTDDRALVPKGLIIRITCYNATGTGRHDNPAAFKLAGRLELFRKKNTIV